MHTLSHASTRFSLPALLLAVALAPLPGAALAQDEHDWDAGEEWDDAADLLELDDDEFDDGFSDWEYDDDWGYGPGGFDDTEGYDDWARGSRAGWREDPSGGREFGDYPLGAVPSVVEERYDGDYFYDEYFTDSRFDNPWEDDEGWNGPAVRRDYTSDWRGGDSTFARWYDELSR